MTAHATQSDIEIVKLGGSILHTPADLEVAVREARRVIALGKRLLLVVSAFAGTTDHLISQARRLFRKPDSPSLARLLATGETTSAAFAVMTLCAAGFRARGIDPADIGLKAVGPPLGARLDGVDATATLGAFRGADALVLPGFFAPNSAGEIVLLGRGGSDQTALFLGRRLAAPCRLIKDTGGLYTADPQIDPTARRYHAASWDTLLRVGGELVQPSAVRFARDHALRFTLVSVDGATATEIGPGPDALAELGNAARRVDPRTEDNALSASGRQAVIGGAS